VLLILASVLIVLGLAPMAWLLWFGLTHNFTPVSMPLPLTRGQVTSPIFKTDLTDNYQIDLDWTWTPAQRIDQPLDIAIDWKIVDLRGIPIRQGTLAQRGPQGNGVRLGFYQPSRRGSRQRIVLEVQRDVPELADAHPVLRVEAPERGLEQAYGSAFAMFLAAVLAGPGVILLVIGLILRPRPSL
jgi:hypothetical protein